MTQEQSPSQAGTSNFSPSPRSFRSARLMSPSAIWASQLRAKKQITPATATANADVWPTRPRGNALDRSQPAATRHTTVANPTATKRRCARLIHFSDAVSWCVRAEARPRRLISTGPPWMSTITADFRSSPR